MESNNMYQDTFVVTDDRRTAKLAELYATLLQHHRKCDELFAAIKQAKGERVAMHTAQYPARELAFEVAHLRMIVALNPMIKMVQSVWDECQRLRKQTFATFHVDTDALARNNIISAEELFDQACALYWEYQIAHYDLHRYQCESVFKLQDADPDCFIFDHGDQSLADLTAVFTPLYRDYKRLLELDEAIKRAKSNRVQRTDDNQRLFADRERRYDAAVAAYRHCALKLHEMLEPLFKAAHAARSAQKIEHIWDEQAVRLVCIAAAEGLYKRAHHAFYAALAERPEFPGIAEQFALEPADPRVFIMRDGVEVDKPLPPPPYQTHAEAVRAGNKWVGFASGYASDVIVDTRVKPKTAD
jgi:hypothetical protein